MTLADRLRQEGREEGHLREVRANLRRVLIRRWLDQAIDAASTADALR